MRHTSAIVIGRHAVIIRVPRRQMEYQLSRGIFLRFWIAESWSDRAFRASFPGKRERSALEEGRYVRDVMRLPEPKEFCQLRPRRATQGFSRAIQHHNSGRTQLFFQTRASFPRPGAFNLGHGHVRSSVLHP